jgi:hypothetical protein
MIANKIADKGIIARAEYENTLIIPILNKRYLV